MDRLIYKEADGDLTCRSRDFDKVFPTLYAYEETGLTPDQVKTLSDNLEALKELAQDLSDALKQARTELETVNKEISGKDLQIQLMAEARNNALAERDALAAELKEEMYRHDRYVDFELAESEELRKAREENSVKDLQLHLLADERNIAQKERDRLAELWAQVPATIKTQVLRICEGEFAEDNNVPGKAVDKTEG